MWEDIKEILLDFLKGFRWYLVVIPLVFFLCILTKYNDIFGFILVFLLLVFVCFVPFIFAFGTILSFIFNTNERECRKHKRKRLERQRKKENRK